ncbi:MAG: Uma2 family endonuclease [Acidobacteria bacterium]|nr:Uma2 family endonuclease [Acidobacteriota bacterium]
MTAVPIPRYSVEQYLALDRSGDQKFDYYDGEMFPVAAASVEHGRIAAKLARRLDERLDGTSCATIAGSVRVRVLPTKFVYPDVLVVCGEPALTDGHADTLTDGDWLSKSYKGPDAEVRIESPGISIPLSEIYLGILP